MKLLIQTLAEQILAQVTEEALKAPLLDTYYSRKHRGAAYSFIGCPGCGQIHEMSDMRDFLLLKNSRNPHDAMKNRKKRFNIE